MTERQRAPVAVAPHLRAIAALVVLGGALVACGAASSPGSSLAHAGASGPTTRATATTPQPRASLVGSARQRQLGLADGLIPDGTTVFDDGIPGITRLDPALLSALRLAAGTAASGGIEIFVTSGWRSRAYQEQLYREAVSKYGSSAEAAQWVAAPGESAHE